MSTGYHAVCRKCRKNACVAVRYAAGNTRFTSVGGPNQTDAAARFIVEHAECGEPVVLLHQDAVPDDCVEVVDILGEVVGS